MTLWTSVAGTLLGGERLRVYLAAREGLIHAVMMDTEERPCTEDEFLRWMGGRDTVREWAAGTGSGLLDAAAMQVEDYMAGRQLWFDLPLQYQGTPFQTEVWKALARIPFGETRSYREIAEAIGKPGAVRAVGQANGRNQLPLIVPCHRVIAASGKLGGFSGGISLKKALLTHEAAVLQKRRDKLRMSA
jgi:methylated-DNA-[protein]-cysteine S-methyltransferase